MSAATRAKTASTGALSGTEKVAVLLLALGKDRSAKLLKKFDPEELKQLTRSAADLRPVRMSDLETLVEEFAQTFSSGVGFAGTVAEVKNLLSGVMTEEQFAEVLSWAEEAAQHVSESVLVLFAASRAVTVMTFAPLCSVTPVMLQLVVPVAVPLPPRSLLQLTCVTPTASAAVPLTLSVAELLVYVVDVVGAVMEMVGAVVSPAATFQLKVCEAVRTLSETVAVTE